MRDLCIHRLERASIGIALSFAMIAAAHAQQPPVQVSDGYLTGSNGMSLYIYDGDTKDARTSLCKGPCTTIWPPLTATEGAHGTGDFSVIERDDGSLQWAYKGKPLYFYARDPGPGARAGVDAAHKWHPAKP